MPEHAPQDIRPGTPPAAPTPAVSKPAGDAFTLKKRFPGEAAYPPPAAAPAPPVRARSGRRYIIAVVLFVVLVGGLAYVAQNLRKRTNVPVPPGRGGAALGKDILKFPEDLREPNPEVVNLFHALWDHPDPKNRGYAQELEKGKNGHYDFVFLNTADTDADVGLEESSCDCSSLEITAVPSAVVADSRAAQPDQATLSRLLAKHAAWVKLDVKNKAKAATIPANGAGVVRVSWHARKNENESLNLLITLWAQAQGAKGKSYPMLHVPTLVVAPIIFERPSRRLGELFAGGTPAEFDCWSATRDDPKLTLAPQTDPLFVWTLTPLNEQERKELEERLKSIRNTRVRAAFRVAVTVYEEKDGRQIDQGSFNRFPPLLLDGEPLDPPGTRIEGMVTGDVEIRGEADGGAVERGQIRFDEIKATKG